MPAPHPGPLSQAAVHLALSAACLCAAPAFAEQVPAPVPVTTATTATTAAAAAAASAPATVLPGDDFYDYVNGAWRRTVQIPADRSSWGIGGELTELTNQRMVKLIDAVPKGATGEARQVADFYATWQDQTAIDARGLAPLQPLLRDIAAIKDRHQLARALGASLRADVDPLNSTNFFTENLFGLWIAQGLSDPQHNTAYVLQGGLGMPDRAYYVDDKPAMAALRVKYLAHVAAMFRLAGLDDADARAARVVALETSLARSHATRQDSADILKANNPWQAADFARQAPGLDWHALWQAAGLGTQQRFIVYHPGAIKGAAALVASTPLQSWQDFLAFHTINHLAGALPLALEQQHFDFYGRTLTGTPEQPPRWKRSLAAVNDAMPDALGKLYVKQYFPPESKRRLQQMVSNIVTAFDARIDRLDWMAPTTKAEAHAKLKTLYVGIGYPDKWVSYGALKVLPGDALGNLLRAEQFHTHQQLAKLGQPVDRGEWAMPAQLVNAVNLPMQNALNFPAAILQAPFFDASASDALNYGSIGATIGHEISHSFDDQGAQFDAQGRLRDWWTAADSAHFQAASKALAAQYSAYQAFPDLNLNGQQTLSENLADLAGLTAAYDAYQITLVNKRMTPDADRQFFIGYATSWRTEQRDAALRRNIQVDGHAPARWRTYTVRNLDAWYQAFDVKPGQTLYLAPGQRVRVW